MSVPRLFYCTVAGLVIATALSFLFGASGLFNYRDLRAYEAHVSVGTVALQDRHRSLQQRIAVLRDNPEALRLLARETGYFRSGETVIEVGPVPVDPTAAAGSRSEHAFADVAPLLQRTPPAPRDPFNALALGLFLGAGSFAALSMLHAFRRRAHAGAASAAGAAPAAGAASGTGYPPDRATDQRNDATHRRDDADQRDDATHQRDHAPRRHVPPAPRGAAMGATPAHHDRATPATPAAGGEAAAETAGRRKKARRRRRDITVYRL